MVKVSTSQSEETDKLDIESWARAIMERTSSAGSDDECEKLIDASRAARDCQHIDSDSSTSWGEEVTVFHAGLEMTELLADLHLDIDALCAAMVYRSVREGKLLEQDIEARFGEEVASLVSGVLCPA